MKPIRTLIMIFCMLGCVHCTGQKTLPPDLNGLWKTKAPGYTNDFLEFTPHNFSVGAGEEKTTFLVQKVKTKDVQGALLIEITCLDGSGIENIYSFYYSQGTLRGKTEKNIVWQKVGK